MQRLAKLLRAALSPPSLRRETALTLTERVSSVTYLISSLEYLARESDRRPGGLNNWQISRDNLRGWPPTVRKVFDLVSDRRATRVIHAARIGAAVTLLAPIRGRPRLLANLLLASTSVLLYPRHHYGTDGTDQVSFHVQTAATLARAGQHRPQLVDACLWYLSSQAVLSYTVSGWAKLAGSAWRNGQALPGVMRTLTYGDPTAWRLLRRYPRTARALGAGTLAMECLFPAVYLARGRLAPAFLTAAGGFHLANARLMGLGRFVWAFGSMYPALLYTVGPRRRPETASAPAESRDDLLPALTAGLAAGAAGAAAIAQQRRRALVWRRRDHEQTLVTSAGNRLAYRRQGPRSGAAPIVILEHGLAATAEHWEWIADRLAVQLPTVVYQRAGYGRSTYAAGAPYTLADSVRDLRELVNEVAGDRPVILAGHSLGGYLALRAAAQLPGRVAGVALLDSSHPAELQRSARQTQGEQAFSNSLTLLPASLRLGLGGLLRRPGWVDQLPERIRELALAQYRDHRMWAAARREWLATRAEFAAFDGQLPPVEVPLLVLTAERTATLDPVQKELHDELAKLAPWAQPQLVAGADHDSLLTDELIAGGVAETIIAFIDTLTERIEPKGE